MKKVQVPLKKMAEDPLFVDPLRLLSLFPFYLSLPEAASIFLEVKHSAYGTYLASLNGENTFNFSKL